MHHMNICPAEHQFKAIRTSIDPSPLSKKYEKFSCYSMMQCNARTLKFSNIYILKAHIFFLQSFLPFKSIMCFPLDTATHARSWLKKVICYSLLFAFSFSFLQNRNTLSCFNLLHITYLKVTVLSTDAHSLFKTFS